MKYQWFLFQKCKHCGQDFQWETKAGGIPQTCSKECSLENTRIRNSTYPRRRSPESLARYQKYRQSPEYKAYHRAYNTTYYQKYRKKWIRHPEKIETNMKYKKRCGICSVEFECAYYNQKYCGSTANKEGCSYKIEKPKKLVPAGRTYMDYVREDAEKRGLNFEKEKEKIKLTRRYV